MKTNFSVLLVALLVLECFGAPVWIGPGEGTLGPVEIMTDEDL